MSIGLDMFYIIWFLYKFITRRTISFIHYTLITDNIYGADGVIVANVATLQLITPAIDPPVGISNAY